MLEVYKITLTLLLQQLPFILLFGTMLYEYASVENLQNHISIISNLLP